MAAGATESKREEMIMHAGISFLIYWRTFMLLSMVLPLGFQMMSCGSHGGDVVFINGKVWTVNEKKPEAEAVVVKGDRIVFVGNNRKASRWIGPETRVVDLTGRLLLPGFNDAHVHFSDGGFSLIQLKLRGAEDRQDFAGRIGVYVRDLPRGAWATGGNWDHEAWPDKRYPDRWLVDPFTKDHPILVNRLDGHVALANSRALQIARITKTTPDPVGGFIERDPKTGEPTGILKDTAMELVSKHIPATPDSVRLKAVTAALKHAAELGITSVQDMSAEHDYHLYQELLRTNRLSCRILAVMPIETHAERLFEQGVGVHSGDSMLRIGSIKNFADGSMGAGSALFFEPYTDEPSTSGLSIYPKDRLMALVENGHSKGLQVITHAIGDKANRWVLDAYEAAIRKTGPKGLRHRIEHAQVVLPEDLPRFAELGVIASIQPSHCIDDMRWAEKRIGKKRCAYAYMYKSFFDAGADVAFGTDWPVEPLTPMLGLYACVTREYPEGGPEGGWYPDQIITMKQAVRSYTLGSAFAQHEESDLGTIEPGKLADLIVLDKDIFSISPKEILETRVDLTMVGGRIVYQR